MIVPLVRAGIASQLPVICPKESALVHCPRKMFCHISSKSLDVSIPIVGVQTPLEHIEETDPDKENPRLHIKYTDVPDEYS